jgi:hypothetical protein
VIGKLVVAGLRPAKIFDVGVGIDVVGAETVAVVTLGLSLTTEEANGSRNTRAFLPLCPTPMITPHRQFTSAS